MYNGIIILIFKVIFFLSYQLNNTHNLSIKTLK